MKVGRKDLCPCGSGRKPQRCCAANPPLSPIPAWKVIARTFLPTVRVDPDPDPLSVCVDRYDVAGPGLEVLVRIGRLKGASHYEDEDGRDVVVISRPGRSRRGIFTDTIVGRVSIEDSRLLVGCVSEKWADTLRARIKRVAGELLHHQDRVTTAPARARPLFSRRHRPEPSREERALLREAIKQGYEGWIDTQLAVLDGVSPRYAAVSSALRPRLIAMLERFEAHESSKPEAERLDADWIWQALELRRWRRRRRMSESGSH